MSDGEAVGKPWQCIQCGEVLGRVIGSELSPSVCGDLVITRGPNLLVRCPHCGASKVFYTSDPVVRAVYQLVDATATAMARRVINEVSEGTVHLKRS